MEEDEAMDVQSTLGRMNAIDTQEMLAECIYALPESEMYAVLLNALTKVQIEELHDAVTRGGDV